MKTVTFKRTHGKPCNPAEVLRRLREAGVPVLGSTWLLGVSSGTLTVTTTSVAVIYQWTDKTPPEPTQPEDEEDEL